jgi:hypothetical protein
MAKAIDLVKPMRMICDGVKVLLYFSEHNSPPAMQIHDFCGETCTNVMATMT